MPTIKLIKILPPHQAKEFDRPTHFNYQRRKTFLSIDQTIKPALELARNNINKVGLLLQYGYFKATGRFFQNNVFSKQDIKFVSEQLGIILKASELKKYNDGTKLLHKELILNLQGFKSFTSSINFFEETVKVLVSRQMNPRKILYSITDTLRENRIEIPEYSKFVVVVSRYFNIFEQELLDKVNNASPTKCLKATKALLTTENTDIHRPLITRLKHIHRTLQPHKIRENLHNYLIIKKMHFEFIKLLEEIEISPEAIKYYAKWVIKAKISQIKEINDENRKVLYVACFINHQLKMMQDNLIDTLLKSMQQQLNKARTSRNESIVTNAPERLKLTKSVLEEYKKVKKSLDEVTMVVYNESMPDKNKIEAIKNILPNRLERYDIEAIFTNGIEDKEVTADKLYIYVANNKLYYTVRNKDTIINRQEITVGNFSDETIFNKIVTAINNKISLNDKEIEVICVITAKEGYNCRKDLETEKVKELAKQIEEEDNNIQFYTALSNLSRKIQNRVADIIKHVDLIVHDSDLELKEAIKAYQENNNLSKGKAPKGILNSAEQEVVYKDGGFNVSLYKALLFIKIVEGIKSGAISLKYSYRYMAIESYLIDSKYWKDNKDSILMRTGLQEFKHVEQVLAKLQVSLDNNFYEVNENIALGKNKYVKLKEDNYIVRTPAIEEVEYEKISEIIGKGRYIPILEMMCQINATTNYTDSFRHHKIKGGKKITTKSLFLAGIFALGSNIGLHKLSNTAIGVNYNSLAHAVNWYFSLENLYEVNNNITSYINKMWLPNRFKKEEEVLHTSSDGQKRAVSVESLNANYSYKYLGHSKGSNVYIFLDERGILFFTRVFRPSAKNDPFWCHFTFKLENL